MGKVDNELIFPLEKVSTTRQTKKKEGKMKEEMVEWVSLNGFRITDKEASEPSECVRSSHPLRATCPSASMPPLWALRDEMCDDGWLGNAKKKFMSWRQRRVILKWAFREDRFGFELWVWNLQSEISHSSRVYWVSELLIWWLEISGNAADLPAKFIDRIFFQQRIWTSLAFPSHWIRI